MNKFLIVGFCSLSFASMVTAQNAFADGTPSSLLNSEITSQIAQKADESAHALKMLEMIQASKTPIVSQPLDTSSLPVELKRKATIHWVGPIEPMLSGIAQNIGYKFSVIGAKPINPVMVNVDENNQDIAAIIENTGLQVQSMATVVLNPNNMSIVLRYNTTLEQDNTTHYYVGKKPKEYHYIHVKGNHS